MSAVLRNSPAPAEDKFLTGEDLYAMGDVGPAELIQGKIRDMPPTGFEHGEVECSIAALLKAYLRSHPIGKAMTGEVGVYIRRDPDTVRAADVLFISHERLGQVRSSSYLDVAPELVVEILSPGDQWSEITEKLEDYFSAGVLQVWLVDPRRKVVQVFRSIQDSILLHEHDALPEAPFLPGFNLQVSEIFG
jgi:Uma2 family endonuclease